MRTCKCSRLPASSRQLGLSPALRRAALHVARFRQGDGVDLRSSVVRIPLEGQELLGLRRDDIVKDSELNTVYEQLVSSKVESNYSKSMQGDRLEVLAYVRDNIISSKGRARDSRDLDLPVDLLPGALALMTEVGQCQLALNIGAELLQSPEVAPVGMRRDVLLSMALANCGLASNSLEGDATEVGPGCGYLEAALQQLEAAGQPPLAPDLAADIRQGLASLKFQGAMEELKSPLGAGKAEARKRAMRTIRDAIRHQVGAMAAPTDALISGLGSIVSAGSARAAAAVRRGASAPRPVETGVDGGEGPVTADAMETLMSVLTCEEVVNLLEWEQVVRSPATRAWCYPGLLEAVSVAHIVHGFVMRQPAYVKIGLSLVQKLPTTPDLRVVEGVCHVLLGAVDQAVVAIKQAERPAKGNGANMSGVSDREVAAGALPASHDAYRFVVAGSAGSDDGMLPGLCMLTERWLTQAAFPFFRDTASPSLPAASLVKYFDDTRVETLLTVYGTKGGGQLGETLSEAFVATKRALRKAAEAGLLATTAPGVGSDAAADPEFVARQRLFRVVAGGFALCAAVAVGLMTPPGQRLMGRGEGAPVALMRQRSPLVPLTVAVEDFDESAARQLLEQWQSAKGWALGAYHTTTELPTLLAEPLLGETLDKVSTLRNHGAHMRFKLQRLQILGVKRVPHKSGPAVRITALLDESADLHSDTDGKPVNTCRRTYDAEYTVVRGKDGAWRMTSSAVTERAV